MKQLLSILSTGTTVAALFAMNTTAFSTDAFAATATKNTSAKTGTQNKEARKEAVEAARKLELATSKNKIEFLVTGDLGGISVPGKLAEDYKGTGPLVGALQLSKNTVTGSAVYELNALTTGIGLRDNHMKNKYLDVKTHPQAKLTIETLTLPDTLVSGATTSAEKVPFTGKMEVKGTTKPVTGTVNVTRKADDYDFKFNWDLKLSDFGIDTPSFMEVTLTEKVSLEASIQGKFL